MNSSTPGVTPLRQRMLDDMRMRKLEPKTQAGYLRAVRHLAVFFKASPDTAAVGGLRRFQLHMVDRGTSPITLNATITGLKFFFEVTLGRIDLMAKMQPVRVAQTLPVVLSRPEVTRLIAAAPNLKSLTALSIAYGAGLRAQGRRRRQRAHDPASRTRQGRKDRYAMLSPVLLERLRAWWRVARAQGKMMPNPADNLADVQWIAQCARRRRQQWPGTDLVTLEEIALELWRDETLKGMGPEEAAALWLWLGAWGGTVQVVSKK